MVASGGSIETKCSTVVLVQAVAASKTARAADFQRDAGMGSFLRSTVMLLTSPKPTTAPVDV